MSVERLYAVSGSVAGCPDTFNLRIIIRKKRKKDDLLPLFFKIPELYLYVLYACAYSNALTAAIAAS